MKRWMSLLTIAIFVVAFATPVVAQAQSSGGCSPSIVGANKTVSGTSGAITVAAAASIAATTGTSQAGANGGNSGNGGTGQGGMGRWEAMALWAVPVAT